jgi:tetratricopeptide (TPR) repeat protein
MSRNGDPRIKIIGKLLDGFKSITERRKKISFFEQIAKISKLNGLTDLELLAEGYRHALIKEYPQSHTKFEKSLAINGNNAYAWNGLGNLYSEQKDYKKARAAYLNAIGLDDKFAFPWNGLGHLYSNQKEYRKAREAFQEAIKLDDKYASPWHNLADMYRVQKKYDKAIEDYLKAIEIDDKFAYPWYGLGNVYSEQNVFEEARKAYQKAIKLDGKFADAYRNYGLTLVDYDLERARDNLQNALWLFKAEKDNYSVSLTKNNLKSVDEKILEEALRVAASSSEKDILKRVLYETKPFETEVYKNQRSFQNFLEKSVSEDNQNAYLKVLRRWNSYTPIVADNYHMSKGGGYFLKFKGKGIVIDPGFNFIDNYKGAGYSFDEIDIVMITHAHNDHTSDLESILTMLYNYNEKQKGIDDFESENTTRADIAITEGCFINKVQPAEIENEFYGGSSRRKTLDIYFTQSVEKKFAGMLRLRSREDYRYHIIEKGDVKSLLDDNLKVSVIGAKHDDITSDRDSVGFVFDFEDTVLVYTGDTGWNETIEKQYSKINLECQGKYLVLLAHLGGFKDYENKYVTGRGKSNVYYKNHLGRLGLARLVQVLKPSICFISEFGEELRMHREELADIYERAFNGATRFLPADIGLEYHLKEKKINAITKLDLDNNEFHRALTEPGDVRTCLLRKDYSLHYYNKKALFKPSDLIQVIIEKFDQSS